MSDGMREALLAAFDAEMSLNRDTLEAVPETGLDWRPHPESFTLGRLAMHVASISGWVRAFATSETYDMGAGGPGPAVPASKAEILDTFASSVATSRELLRALDDDALAAPWTLLRHGDVIATMTRAEAISRYVIRHVVHHRGQLTVYLRLAGAPVPALYGDSADRRMLPPGLTPGSAAHE